MYALWLVRRSRRWRTALTFAAAAVFLSACSLLTDPRHGRAPQDLSEAQPEAPALAPLATHRFEFDPLHDDVVGLIQITTATAGDTLPDIARRFNLGYEEVVRANPGVDPWLPGEGRQIVLPTRFVLPHGPREGVVINVPAMRLFYFPPREKPREKDGEKASTATVITHPIGIGKVGWATPEGSTKIIQRTKDPTWYVPASVREEHRKNGDPLPASVPPGPDNPLGAYSLRLGWPTYLVHGTNKPYGVGMRSSHGCIRLYPEDIEQLFAMLPVGTKVRVVNQPFLFGRAGDDALVLQPYGVLEDDRRDWEKSHRKLLDKTLSAQIRESLQTRELEIDWAHVETLVEQPRGLPLLVKLLAAGQAPAGEADDGVAAVLLAARRIRNELPQGATWDGEVQFDARKFEQLLSDREPDAAGPKLPQPADGRGIPQ
jgi:L,D-transpeptidase ErfK/SrfK